MKRLAIMAAALVLGVSAMPREAQAGLRLNFYLVDGEPLCVGACGNVNCCTTPPPK